VVLDPSNYFMNQQDFSIAVKFYNVFQDISSWDRHFYIEFGYEENVYDNGLWNVSTTTTRGAICGDHGFNASKEELSNLGLQDSFCPEKVFDFRISG